MGKILTQIWSIVGGAIGFRVLAVRPLLVALTAFALGVSYSPATAQRTPDLSAARDIVSVLRNNSAIRVVTSTTQLTCLFDQDCSVTVQIDDVDELTFIGGNGRLQSRVLPAGLKGTPGEGLRPFLYRIDLSDTFNTEAQQCVNRLSLPVADIVPLDYNGDQQPDHIFISPGRRGQTGPARATYKDGILTFYFNGLCGGGGPNQVPGESSLFFGYASKGEAASIAATAIDNFTRSYTLKSRASGRPNQDRPLSEESVAEIATPLPGTTRTLDFETFDRKQTGERVGAGFAMTDQFAASHGIRFRSGFSVQPCSDQTFRATTANITYYCRYPKAASGEIAGFYDGTSNQGILTLDFDHPVRRAQLRINPTGGQRGERFEVILTGYAGDNRQIAQSRQTLSWDDMALTWPTLAILDGDGSSFTSMTVRLRSLDQNDRGTRFLIDDLSLEFAPERSPLAAAIFDLSLIHI